MDRLWQEHLFGMDALREGIQLQRIGQKDPLVEYKNEAYSMFVELMANIKFEVLHNLFRSTSNLQAFEKFLASLPQTLLHESLSSGQPPRPAHQSSLLNPIADGISPRPAPASTARGRRRAPATRDPHPAGVAAESGETTRAHAVAARNSKNCCGKPV